MEQWANAEWRQDVTAWVDRQLATNGRTRAGDLEVERLRPWGTVLRARTTAGTVFMKAPAPASAFEAGLYQLLVEVVPDRVLHPIALDVQAGWILLPDGGPVLGEQLDGEDLLDSLAEVARQYGQMQLDLAPHVDGLLALGLTDMRPERMAERFDEALVVGRRGADAEGGREKAAALDRVAALRAPFQDWCQRLAGAPGPPTLDHNDLHGGNVFAEGQPGALEARFFDWGDAVVAHPFASALVLRSVVRWILGVDSETPRERAIIDAYLQPFASLGPHEELVEVVNVACEVAKVARSLVWARAVAPMAPEDDDPDGFASAPLDWMLELLDGPLAPT